MFVISLVPAVSADGSIQDGTVVCPDAEPGETITVDGEDYVVADDDTIEDLIDDDEKVCTTHVTDMRALFQDVDDTVIFCYTQGSKVHTSEGLVKIENIEGDELIKYNDGYSEIRSYQELGTWEYDIWTVHTSQNDLELTGSKYVLTQEEGRILVPELQEGMTVETVDGFEQVNKIEHEVREETFYDLTIKDHDMFFLEGHSVGYDEHGDLVNKMSQEDTEKTLISKILDKIRLMYPF